MTIIVPCPDGDPAMRYLMRQKWLSWTDSFEIEDEQGQPAFTVQGAIFSWGNHLTIRDATGSEVAEVKQVVFSWGQNYEVYRGGALWARVNKEWFTLFKARFASDVPGPDDLEAEGDFFDHEYEFRRGTRVVARVSKKWFSWTDAYGVEVLPGADPLLIIASTVVIDCVGHDKRSQND